MPEANDSSDDASPPPDSDSPDDQAAEKSADDQSNTDATANDVDSNTDTDTPQQQGQEKSDADQSNTQATADDVDSSSDTDSDAQQAQQTAADDQSNADATADDVDTSTDTDDANQQAQEAADDAASNAAAGSSGGLSAGSFAGGAIAAGAGGALAAGGMAASMVSAMIQCTDEPFPPIVFSYNPAEYTETFEGVWRKSLQPATDGGAPQWVGYKPQDVHVKILLDEFAIPPPVMPLAAVVAQLRMMVKPTALSLGDGRATAPMVMFMWGDNIILDQAYIRSVVVNYQRFFLGNPVRAEADIHLSQVPFPTPLGGTNPTSGGVATRKTRTMVAGDSLPSIAFQEYKDPNKWRALAEANRIDDPMRIKMGTVIAVPDRREAENLS
jgi:nucleoid-associated protein YgaU